MFEYYKHIFQTVKSIMIVLNEVTNQKPKNKMETTVLIDTITYKPKNESAALKRQSTFFANCRKQKWARM